MADLAVPQQHLARSLILELFQRAARSGRNFNWMLKPSPEGTVLFLEYWLLGQYLPHPEEVSAGTCEWE